MDMFEEARAIRSMISLFSSTQTDVAKRMGVSQSYVANKLRLLQFSPDIQGLILSSGLSERHARLLLRLKDEERVRTAIEKILAMHLTVMETDALIDSMLLDDMPGGLLNYKTNEQIAHFESIISESIKNMQSLGIKVQKTTDIYAGKKYVTLCYDA